MPALPPTPRERTSLLVAIVVPLALCAALIPVRDRVPNTDAALVLVGVVVAVAAFADRLPGWVASVSAAVWFDLFLTRPYGRFAITRGVDIGTALLLVLVGGAVTELAVRGRRHRLRALDDERYLLAIQQTTALIDARGDQRALTAHVAEELVSLLGLRSARFEANRFGGLPQLTSDGRIVDQDDVWDLDRRGFPATELELVAAVQGRRLGRFVLDPRPGLCPAMAARRCAAVLAGQVGGALSGQPSSTRPVDG